MTRRPVSCCYRAMRVAGRPSSRVGTACAVARVNRANGPVGAH